VVELVNFKVTAVGAIPAPRLGDWRPSGAPDPKEVRPVHFRESGSWVDCPIYDRETLPTDARLVGPAVIEEAMATTLVLPGQRLRLDRYGNLIIQTNRAAVDGS